MYRTPSTVLKQQLRDDEALARALQVEFDKDSTSLVNQRAFNEPLAEFQPPTSLVHPFPVHAATVPLGPTVLPQRIRNQTQGNSLHPKQQQPPTFGHSRSLGRTFSDPDMLFELLPFGFPPFDVPPVQSHPSQSQPRVIPVTYVGDDARFRHTTGGGTQQGARSGWPLDSTSEGTSTSASVASKGQRECEVPFGMVRSDSEGPNGRWLELMHAGDEWAAANALSDADAAAGAAGAHATASRGAVDETTGDNDFTSDWRQAGEGGRRQRGPVAGGGGEMGGRATEDNGSLPSSAAAPPAAASGSDTHLNTCDSVGPNGGYSHHHHQHVRHGQQQREGSNGTRAGVRNDSQHEAEPPIGRSTSLEGRQQWQQWQQHQRRSRQEQEDRDYALALTMACPDMGERGSPPQGYDVNRRIEGGREGVREGWMEEGRRNTEGERWRVAASVLEPQCGYHTARVAL